jgi:hypothetical protein
MMAPLPMSFSICANTFFNSLLCDGSAMFFPSCVDEWRRVPREFSMKSHPRIGVQMLF